jgi:GntR family transcriptional regulator
LIEIDKKSDTPIYEQIAQRIISQILSGSLRPGERIPSVRQLARQLSVNPNTIQKSYAGLLENGIIYSIKGKGDFVANNLNALRYMKKKELITELVQLTQEAKQAGLWIDELLSTVDSAYSERLI